MKKCVSNLRLHLENLLKHRLVDTTTIVSDSEDLGHGPRICISASSPMMLILLVHPLRTTDREQTECGGKRVFSRVKVATEPPISQKRDCNEKWLQPLTSRMNQCVHVLVTQLSQQRAGGSFFTGWIWECLQSGHTHTKIYEICNPNSIYTAGLEPPYIIRASQTSNAILHGFQVTHFFHILPSLESRCIVLSLSTGPLYLSLWYEKGDGVMCEK